MGGRAVYVDCFSGASGDMLLGALLDAGVSLEALQSALRSLPISGWQLTAERVQERGLTGTRAGVTLEDVEQPQRSLGDIQAIVGAAEALAEPVRERACNVF